ncbi:hypothetical protein AVEN_125987-1, partial [Araneus ventricosus]
YDIGKNDTLTIEDSDRFRIALKGYGNFVDEKKAFISDGKMVITYRRKVVATAHQRQGFQFTYTAVKRTKTTIEIQTKRSPMTSFRSKRSHVTLRANEKRPQPNHSRIRKYARVDLGNRGRVAILAFLTPNSA